MANKNARAARTATEALSVLWEDGFFVSPKKKVAIESALSKRGNHFNDAEMGMALMRAKHLTRKGKRGGYEYIQKYPYSLNNRIENKSHVASARGKRDARKR